MPSDHFATLGQTRRPWLDPDELKEAFHRLTAEKHPDKAGDGSAFADVNAAYAVLRDPVLRLRHLLELDGGEAPGEAANIPDQLADSFMRVATLRRAIDSFVQQQEGAGTPLAKALLASERFALQRDVERELAALETAYEVGVGAIRAADPAWHDRQPQLVQDLGDLQQELSYVAKWIWQLREALYRLGASA